MLNQKSHSAPSYKMLSISSPGSGGLNIQDLDYQLKDNQSPHMLNMMMKNGSFGKRFGQKTFKTFDNTIINIGKFMNKLILHVGDELIEYDPANDSSVTIGTVGSLKGIFINFNRILYYMNDKYYQYDGTDFKEVECYAPDICINRKPDGSYSDLIEDYNRLGTAFKNTFHGDGSSTVYVLTDKNLDEVTPLVEVDGKEVTSGFTVDYVNGKVTFSSAPSKGTNNVVITAYKTEQEYIDSIMNSKYWAAYGGQNNSRLFLAGAGKAIYYYSDVFDATYFPEMNYATLGNGEEDITGFGNQYDVLVVFKPSEIYAVAYYFQADADGIQQAYFSSGIISSSIGCDVPESISFVDNKLIWASTQQGVCLLVQTVIKDERNVQVISRNINGGSRRSGLLQEKDLGKAIAINYDGKYCLCINGNAYLWDYQLSPYTTDTKTPDLNARNLSWFLWNNIYLNGYMILDRQLYYCYGQDLNIFTDNYDDFGKSINAYYQTPLFDFDNPDMLKTIKRMYITVRGDTPSRTKMKYITEENPNGEEELEDIQIFTKLWNEFSWHTFGWQLVTYAKTFSRKCSIKKVQLFGILFSNNEVDKNMSFSNLELMYLLAKVVK